MEELKKKPEFMLAKDYDNSTLNWEPINMSNVKGLLNLPTPEYQTLEEYSKSFKMNKEIFEDLSRLTEPKEATTGEKIKAGFDRLALDVKNTPATIRNAMYRHFDGLSFPNASAEEAWQITKANTYALQDLRQRQAEKEEREGTSDSWIASITEGVGQSVLFGITSALSPLGGLALMSAKEMAETQQEWAYQAYEKGENLTSTDILAADGVGLINGWLENALGVERLGRQIVTRTMLGRFAKTVGKTAIEEGAEEAAQAAVSSLFGTITGNDNRTLGEKVFDAAGQAVFGAVVGGIAGSGGYYLGRRRMMTQLSQAGFTEEEAKEITDEIIDTGKSAIVEELRARNQLTEGYGEAYDKLAGSIKNALDFAGWQERFPDRDIDEFAKANAKTLVAPAIKFSNIYQIPMMDILDLMKIRVEDNVFYLDMPNIDNPQEIAKQVKENKEEIEALKDQLGIDNKKPIEELQKKNKILKKRLKNLGYKEEKAQRVRNREKANQDQKVIASTKSEVLGDLSSIRQANETEKFVYVGNSRVAVKYVVKPMAEVQASHVAGVANPNYTFKELQNRTRGTVVDDAILQNRAANLRPEELAESPNTQYGAPVVNLNGEIISGNGRYETLRRAYELGDKSYVKMLKKLGYNVEGIERPILVRETVDNLTPEQQIAIAEASNVSETSAFDHARQASNDAKYLKKGIADPRTFGDSLPVEERQGYIREDGTYDLLALQRRFDDAVMAWILDDTKVFDALVLSNKTEAKIMKGLSMQGGSIVDFQNNYPQIGLREDLKYALIKSASIKSRGQFIPAIQQQDVESGTTFSADALLYFMKFSKNSSELSNCLESYISKHQGYLESEKNNLFGDALPKQTREDITGQVLRGVKLEDDAFTPEGAANNANMKAIFANQIPVEDIAYGTVNVLPENTLLQEELELANENARLDDIYPEYKGETININGKERTVYNSNGDRIAKSKEALENFYRWFGDSKVVDEQGRPKVMYHGTPNAIYDTLRAGTYFTDNKAYAEVYKSQGASSISYKKEAVKPDVYAVYIKMEKPFDTRNKEARDDFYKYYYQQMGMGTDLQESGLPDWNDGRDLLEFITEYHPELGYDGILLDEGGVGGYGEDVKSRGISYVNISPNQIKSTSNRGTYSGSENIYYQEDDDKDLYATHNMSLAGVREALKLGGLAMPSLAMRKVSQGNINQFGDIVFVANERLATPSRTNEVYDRDAWTPNLGYAIKYDLKPEAQTFIKDVLERVGQRQQLTMYVYNITENLTSPQSNDMAIELYHLDKMSKSDEPVHFDRNSPEYLDWYDEHFTANTEPYLWTENASNTDMVRKKFTLDNMMKILRKQEKSGGGFIGDYIFDVYKLLNFRSQKFKNLKEIKKNRSKLVSREEQKEALDKLNEDFLALAEELKKEGEDYGFGDATYGLGLALIQDNDEKIVYWLNDRNLQSDEKAVKKVKDFIERMKDIPTDYFEVKPRRAVDFSEFSGVIIPEGTQYDEVARKLEKQYYLNVERVEKGNEVQYENALQNIQAKASTTFFQSTKAINGFFDADLKAIVIGSNFNFGTLQHEVAHFYLDRLFSLYKSGAGNEKFKEDMAKLFSILNIDENQEKLSRDQQEQFASMSEAYLFNKGIFPDGAEPAMKMFFDWCPPQYNTIANVGFHNEKGEFVPALFNKESLEFFDAMYSEVPYMAEPNFAKSFENPVMTDGSQPKATQEEQENRKKLIDSQIVEEPVEPLTTQKEGVQEAYFEGRNREDPLVKEAYEEAIETAQEKPKTATEKFIQYVLPGRGTNTRADMDRVAQEYIAKNRENAERVAFGSPIPQSTADMMGVEPTSDYVENNTGIDRAVLILNLMKEYSENSPEYQQLYHNFALHRSYASKSAGLTNDVSTNFYMKGYSTIEKAIAERAAVVRYGAKKNAINRFNADVDNFIKANIDSVIKTLPESAERDRALREVVEKMNAMFGSEDSTFFQEDLTARKIRKGDKAAFTSWATRKIRRIQAGKETAEYSLEELMRVSIMAQKTLPDLNSNDPDKAVNASRNIREWQDFVNNKSKGLSDSAINKFIGEYMPRAMLSAPSTHIKNNISNAINYVMTKAAMRFHFGENRVSEYLIKKEQERLWTIYKATGQNLTDSMTADQVSRLHGERYMIPEAKGFLQSIDPFRWLGYEDFYFRSHMYLDTLGRIATQDANGDSKRAGELFNEYKKLGTTGRAKEARQQAIIAGNMAVFTQDGTLAKIVSNVRGELNRINFTQFGEKGYQGLGTLIAPFAKVPSNIVGMGIEAMASPFKALSYNLYKTTGIKGFKNNWTIQDSIALTNFGGLVASVLAMIAAGADYEPPYEVGKPYDQNKPYDSVRLGGVWISVESFGALATPLRFTLTCLKGVERGQDPNKIVGTAFDTVARDIPFTDFSYEYFMKKPVDWIKNETYNQASKAIPAIVKTPIRLAMRETGITITPERGGFIPQNIQRKFARQYGLDGQENSVNDFIRFIYNGVTIEE